MILSLILIYSRVGNCFYERKFFRKIIGLTLEILVIPAPR